MRINFLDLGVRYLLLIGFGIFIGVFYFIFSPLTIYSSFFLIDLVYEPILDGNLIILQNIHVRIIDACVAGSAYYLLLILNLATPNLKLKKRIWLISLSFLALLVMNILRIFILSMLAISGNSLFTATHEIFWYLLSTLFVAGLWLAEVRLFKIKEIPFYSDIKNIFRFTKVT